MTKQQFEVLALILQHVEACAGQKVVHVKVEDVGGGVQNIVEVKLAGAAA